MIKKFFVLFGCISLCVILLGKIAYCQQDAVGDALDAFSLKEKLKTLERIVSQQRNGYFALKDRIRALEEENQYIPALKEQLTLFQGQLLLVERQKGILELMANKEAKTLKRPSLVKADGNLDKAIHINLGYAYGMKGKIQNAIEEYSQAKKFDPEDKDIHYNLGHLLAKKDRHKDAIEEYKKALSGDSSDKEIYYNLAIIYSANLKDKKMADYYYEKFLSAP
jgi:tetratricopeptide (TPR) repeat protein